MEKANEPNKNSELAEETRKTLDEVMPEAVRKVLGRKMHKMKWHWSNGKKKEDGGAGFDIDTEGEKEVILGLVDEMRKLIEKEG